MVERGERRTRRALWGLSLTILAVLAVAVAGVLASQGIPASGDGEGDMGSGSPRGDVVHRPLQITDVRVEVDEGGVVALRVTGIVPDACTRALPPQIARQGQQIEVTILSERPRDALCAQVTSEYAETIALGALEPGEYAISVNGFQTSARVEANAGSPPAGEMLIRPVQVTGVDVRIAESFPPQGFAEVTGVLGDGCTEALEPTVQRDGDVITVTILSQRPRDVICTMIAKEYRETVALGALEPGKQYTLRVNDYETVLSAS
jgi:hypothetical protein